MQRFDNAEELEKSVFWHENPNKKSRKLLKINALLLKISASTDEN